MIGQKEVSEKLYEKYIEPTKKKREEFVGIEIEMPILNLDKRAVDFKKVHEITDRFLEKFSFEAEGIDSQGNIYSAIDKNTGDILSYDCSYNNLELSLGKAKDLKTLSFRFEKYYSFLQGELSKYHYTLTGMGVNPYRIYNNNVPIPNERYRMLFHHLGSYKKYENLPMHFHNYPEYGTFSSASQVQLDVDYDDLIITLEAFSKLEPIKALLFSNSVLLGEHEELLCCRDAFWENSTHGINPHNIGMFLTEFENIDDLQAYIQSTSIYCVMRDGKYINFPPIKIMEYFKKQTILGEFFNGETYEEIRFEPEIEDIDYLRTFKFEDLTFRGTIEFRSVCCQPIKDSMTVAAFHLGLKNEVEALYDMLKNDKVIYHKGYNAAELRKLFVRNELPEFVDENALYQLTEKILELSRTGLMKRGYGEEKYLEPLYRRAADRTNPAKRMLSLRDSGIDLEEIIKEYSEI